MIYTTLKEIREAHPCDSFDTLLGHLGKTGTDAKTDETPLPVLTVLESNGLDDALWVIDNVVRNQRICSLFAADCAERVLPIFENAMPGDDRPRKAIACARNSEATNEDREAAWAAAMAAALAATGDAACDAAWAATGDAACDAALAAESDAQKKRLRQYLTHGEAAASMPWPEAK